MSGNRTCPACGAPISLDTSECRYCGEKLIVSQPKNNTSQTQNESPQSQYTQPQYQTTYVTSQYTQTTYVAPKKSKIVAGLLAIFFGGIGAHKFYLGKVWSGIFYLLFCWTAIPTIVSIFEGIKYLVISEEKFYKKYVLR